MSSRSQNTEYKEVILFIWRIIQPFSTWVMSQVGIAIIFAIGISLRPYCLKLIVDAVSQSKIGATSPQLLFSIGLYVAMATVLVGAYYAYDYIWMLLNSHIKRLLGVTLMERMVEHSYGLHQSYFSGNLANKINDVINGVPVLIKRFIDQSFNDLLSLFIAVYAVWHVSPKFSLGLVLWIALFLFVSFHLSRKSQQLSDHASEMRSTAVGHIVDVLGNMVNVFLFNGRNREIRHLDSFFHKAMSADQRRDLFFARVLAFQGISFVLFQCLCLWWLIAGLKEGSVTAGDFALILSINVAIVDNLWSILDDLRVFTESFGIVSQGLRVALLPTDMQDLPSARSLTVTHGEIMFKAVTFAYEDTEPIFNNISLLIKPGQKIGIVGYSGSGKTTFAHLIMRLFDVTSGSITIDGVDLREYTRDSLRAAITVVPQNLTLFHRSLFENISYGRADATDEEVITAAKKAYVHDFVERLRQHYDTIVGDHGVKLSGGQRQRIALARAFLKNSPIIIFDEATSQFDPVSETLIQNAMHEVMHNKTAIIIAHRLSTLVGMDRILVFENGKIVQDGTHNELLAQQGLYNRMWSVQHAPMVTQ